MKVRDLQFSHENAQDRFTDRKEPRKAFWDVYNSMEDGDVEVINYYGDGGIGKTSLLKCILSEVDNQTTSDTFMYGFDFNPSYLDFLFVLSRRIMLNDEQKRPFYVFDYAYSRILATKYGYTETDLENRLKSKESPKAVTYGKKALTFAADFIPYCSNTFEMLGEKVFDFFEKRLTDKKTRIDVDIKSRIYEISKMDADDIEKQIQKYFAFDAKSVLSTLSRPMVILLDGYEYLVNILRDGDLAYTNENWLCGIDGIVYYLPNVLWVIAGRQKLSWSEEILPSENSHLIGELSDNDTENYFKNAGINPNLALELRKLTKGVPVYMDLCYDTYKKLKQNKESITIDKFGENTDELAERFYQNMEVSQQKAFRFLCCLPLFWNDELVMMVCDSDKEIEFEYKSSVSINLDIIKKLSLVRKENGYFCIHEIQRDAILNHMDKNEQSKIRMATMDVMLKWKAGRDSSDNSFIDLDSILIHLQEYQEYYREWKELTKSDTEKAVPIKDVHINTVNSFEEVETIKKDKYDKSMDLRTLSYAKAIIKNREKEEEQP